MSDLLTLTQAEIASNCTISRFTFRELAATKKIAAKKVNGKWCIPIQAVAELVASGYQPRRGRPRKYAA
jgi:predicted DNA-binding protein (UPF0251 family)